MSHTSDWSNLFLRDRRLLLLVLGLILVAGISSSMVLPRMEDPLLAPRAASVTTLLPGADALRVESLVTEKIEDELKKIQEIKEIRSNSRLGVSFVQIELLDSVTAEEAPAVWSRVRGKVDDAQVLLPAEASRPEFDQIDVKAFALLVSLNWNEATPINHAILRRWARALEERLRAVPGTEKTELVGDPDEEIVVTVDAERAAALGLTVQQVSQQIRASDSKVAAGQIRNPNGDMLLEVSGEIETLTRLESTPIRINQSGAVVQLSDIARVEKTALDPPLTQAVISGKPAIVVGALVRSDARIDQWAKSVQPILAAVSDELPPAVAMQIVFNQSDYVESRLTNLTGNLILGALAVIAVIWLMMGWRSAVIVGSALPLAALMVLAALRGLEIPIHQMSITGLIIALGLLIDNAIVMVDEVVMEMREGHSPLAAVSKSVKLLAVPLFGSTLTTALAFGPIALMPGPAGEFVGSIAISVILAVCSSFILAMTVVPALAAWGIPVREGSNSWWQIGFRSVWLGAKWRQLIDLFLRYPKTSIAISVTPALLGFVVATQLPEQFFPPAERDQLYIEVELSASSSLTETQVLTAKMRQEILQVSSVQDVHWFLGESAPIFYYNLIPTRKNVARYAQAIVQRDTAEDNVDFIQRLQQQLNRSYPEALILVRQLEQGPPFYAPIELRLFGPDLDRLRELGDQMRLVLTQTPKVISTRSELAESLPKIGFVVDESQSRLLQLDHAAIAQQLNSALEGMVGGSILEATEELPIRVRWNNAARSDFNQIAALNLLTANNSMLASESGTNRERRPDFAGVPLSSIASAKLDAEVAGVPRFNGRRMNEVQAFIRAGQLPAPVLADFEQRLLDSGFSLPPGYELSYGGEQAKRNDAIGNLMANVGVLGILMVATLVLSFQSFRLASVIGLVALLSVGLSMGALWLYGYSFGFMAIVGTMGLIGVAINDSIVVLAAIRGDTRAKHGDRAAIRDVVARSTRHVLATTFTTMAGFVPLILSGGGFWPPLAVAISGGIAGATIIALVMVPAVYAMSHQRPMTVT